MSFDFISKEEEEKEKEDKNRKWRDFRYTWRLKVKKWPREEQNIMNPIVNLGLLT